MRNIKFLVLASILFAPIFCRAAEDISNQSYLDIYLISTLSDIRNYILVLEFSDGKSKEQDELLREALEMKYYDLTNFFPKTNSAKVIEVVCKAENTLHDNALRVSGNCSGELCVEIQKLKDACSKPVN